jgi:hypothetical protein
LLLALNSAADSAIAKRILQSLAVRNISKVVRHGSVAYNPPLLLSATSTSDLATKLAWRVAQFLNVTRRTDGNDAALRTHELRLEDPNVTCSPTGFLDLGQNWHCLRIPRPPSGASTPHIPIDLPTRARRGVDERSVPHARYVLTPSRSPNTAQLMWAFQVPSEIINGHNDVFNSCAASMVLGLIQISGAVASLAEDWEGSFE